MDLLLHFMEHALEDTLALVPFLFVTYIALEALEHAAGNRANVVVRRAGAAGPVAGALLGIVPQCGFSAMAATLYAGRVVTLGTLVAVFLSTSDEMLPMLVAERVDAQPWTCCCISWSMRSRTPSRSCRSCSSRTSRSRRSSTPRATARTSWFAAPGPPGPWRAHCWALCRSAASRPWLPRSTPVAW